jgi:hypothetical protein
MVGFDDRNALQRFLTDSIEECDRVFEIPQTILILGLLDKICESMVDSIFCSLEITYLICRLSQMGTYQIYR